MKKYIGMLLIFLMVAAGCSDSPAEEKEINKGAEGKIKIYTTIFPLQDFTKKIGGKYVEVENVVPPGSDAHSFEPTTKTMVKIAEGDAFVYLGTGIEGFADSVIAAMNNEKTAIVNSSQGVKLISADGSQAATEEDDEGEEEGEHEEEANGVDPHVWLDPSRSIQLAYNIKQALIKIEPGKAEFFEENFNTLKKDLVELDKSFKEMVNGSPNRTFIVAHSAYGYWEDAYGLKQVGIAGLSPGMEPSQKKLEEIIQLAEENEINYIFFEQNVENRVAEVIKKEIGAKTLTLHNLEALSEEDEKNGEDFISIMQKNIEALKQVLK